MIQEIHAAGVYRDIGQAFCVLLPVKSVGVMGDGRTYEQVCAIRCVQTTDFMTADWYHMDYSLLGRISNRIINEVCHTCSFKLIVYMCVCLYAFPDIK